MLGIGVSADSDFYRLRSGYMGPIAITGAADDGDIDIVVMDGSGNVLYEDANFDTTETEDEDGQRHRHAQSALLHGSGRKGR